MRQKIWFQKGVSDTQMQADLAQCKENLVETGGIHRCMEGKGYLLLPREEVELLKVKALQQQGLEDNEIAQSLRWREKKVSRYTDSEYDLGSVKNLGRQPVDVLADLGKAGVVPLIGELKSQSPLVRRQAVQALGEIRDPRAVEPLITALKDRDALIRRHVVESLGKIGDVRAVSPLLMMMADRGEPSHVKMAVAEALGAIGEPQAVPALINALRSSDWGVRSRAAWALGKIKDPRGIRSLMDALKDADSTMRGYAAEALGEIGATEAMEVLQTVADTDREKHVRIKARTALKKIETRHGLR